jgi:hypothetical protein
MTSNEMFQLTLKPTMNKNTMQDVYDTKYAQPDTSFKSESKEVSVCGSKERKVSVRSFKKEKDNGT